MFLTYQLSMVGYWPSMAVTRPIESAFESGEAMAEEEVAKLIVGNDSGMCNVSFAGDVPRMFSLIKNSFCV